MSKATTVEQTANGLSTKITEQGKTLNATVKTANEAKSTADSNKQTISQVSTTASSALTKASTVEQNLNGFKTTVAETYTTKTDFNNLTIGGRNLLVNSNFSKGTNNWVLELQNNGLGTVKAEALSGFAFATTMLTINVTKSTTNLCRIYQLRSPNPMRTDTVDTVSFWATASESVPVQFGRNDDQKFITVQKGWHYYKATVSKWNGSNAFVIGLKNGFVGTLKITNIMWEHASKASQWSPAPEDLQPAGDYATNSSLTQTANSIKAQVTEVSKTANGAMSKATTVEQTANGLSTKITEQGKTLNATVKTANEAKSTADSNKQTISQVSTTASSALTKASTVEQNLNGFKTTVAETYTTKTDFNNLTIGGRNLLVNSNFSKGTNNWVLELQNNGLGTVKAEALSGFAFATTMLTINVTKSTTNLCRIYQLRSPNPMRTDTVDTVSFWATASESVPVQFGRNDDQKFITVQKGWHYYKATVSKWNGSNAFVIGLKNGFVGTLKITNIMWEHASKASQWSPAPEDLQPAGDYSTKSYVDQTAKSVALGVVQNYKGSDGSGLATKSDITVAKDSITSTVSKTYQTKEGMSNYVTQSQIQQTNDKVTIAFQNAQAVGGQNLLLKTGVPTTVEGRKAANQCVAFYSLAVGSLKNLPVGMYHLQFKIKSDTAGGTAVAQWNTTPWGLGSSTKINIGTTEQTYSVDCYITNNDYPNAKQITVRLDNAKGNVTIREMKLERGNSMTPWTAAPEDTMNDLTNTVQNQATDIANKVSNDDYNGYVNATNKNLSDIQDSQQHLSDAVNNEIKLRESYIQFGQDESNPYMDMGNTSSPNKMRLTNTKLSFTSNNIEVASVSNDKMRISNAEVLQSLRIGNFVWQPRSDGHMALKYSPEV
jgi:ABC-type transporter Mla subunit MlaD